MFDSLFDFTGGILFSGLYCGLCCQMNRAFKSSNCNVAVLFILLFCSCSLTYGPHLKIIRLQGTDEGNQHSVIKALPAASLLQTPGARADAATWCDVTSGLVWLFGGEGYDDNASRVQPKLLNDLWLFNTSRLEWNMIRSGRIQSTYSTNGGDNSKLFKVEICENCTSIAPKPRKRAVSCGVPGIVFIVFGGIDEMGSSLSDTWIYTIGKARWMLLSRNITQSIHPPSTWSTKTSWCHLDALYVVGNSTGNVMEMWKLSLRTLEWANESQYLTEQQHCGYGLLPLTQPASTNLISIVWNGTFYLYQWQINHSDNNSLMLSVDLQKWHLLPSMKFMNNWHSTPFLWTDLNSHNMGSIACVSPSIFHHLYDHNDDSSQECSLHGCYKITSSISWPKQRLHASSWFYEGNIYVFGGQILVNNNSKTFLNDLCILQQSDTANSNPNSVVLVLTLITVVVAFVLLGFGMFCILRYWDYRRGRKKSRELRIRYTPLRNVTLYE